jgi:hypothetical protein
MAQPPSLASSDSAGTPAATGAVLRAARCAVSCGSRASRSPPRRGVAPRCDARPTAVRGDPPRSRCSAPRRTASSPRAARETSRLRCETGTRLQQPQSGALVPSVFPCIAFAPSCRLPRAEVGEQVFVPDGTPESEWPSVFDEAVSRLEAEAKRAAPLSRGCRVGGDVWAPTSPFRATSGRLSASVDEGGRSSRSLLTSPGASRRGVTLPGDWLGRKDCRGRAPGSEYLRRTAVDAWTRDPGHATAAYIFFEARAYHRPDG